MRPRKIIVTGSRGFIGKNLVARFRELPEFEVMEWHRGSTLNDLEELAHSCDAIVHLAGENRPKDESAFQKTNVDLTRALCKIVGATGKRVPVVFASSSQADLSNPYGQSKRSAEMLLEEFSRTTQTPCVVYRLPGVFGKWARPNYNSVVATFCHNLARDLPIRIDDPSKLLTLVYIDDVVNEFIRVLRSFPEGFHSGRVETQHEIAVGEVARMIENIRTSRDSLVSEPVGGGLLRALYATYTSYLPTSKFSYPLKQHSDPRGKFVEFLRTRDSGQFSFFTAHPGISRGGHYHHTKVEKFLVLQGEARFRFRDIQTNELFELFTSGESPMVVESIPGWSHEVTNVGQDTLIVMLWASERFDVNLPDTFASKVWNE